MHRLLINGLAGLRQNFKYFLILDFEATCMKDRLIPNQEIIEFPVLLLPTESLATSTHFHQFVKPMFNPMLTPFCQNLTHIRQEDLDVSRTFPQVWTMFLEWMEASIPGYANRTDFLFITFGNWDLATMLPKNLSYFNMQVPGSFRIWLNMKDLCAEVTGKYPKCLSQMAEDLHTTIVGKLHSGYDDCRTIAKLMRVLATVEQHQVMQQHHKSADLDDDNRNANYFSALHGKPSSKS